MSDDILYFDDFIVGDQFSSPARTVTEADVVNFAGLSGDYNALHVDQEYAKETVYGGRIAHGLLGLTIASGLFTRTELNRRMNKTIVAMLGIDSWKFRGPLRIGDTIHLQVEIVDKKETSKGDRGIVFFKRMVVNQKGEEIQEGIIPMMILKRSSDQ